MLLQRPQQSLRASTDQRANGSAVKRSGVV
jgi:hypothetical protein